MSDPFVRNPCRYPDELRARAPRGFRDQVKRAANAERITMGEFVRRAVAERIEAVRSDGDDPGPFSPASGRRTAA
jgi:hypothetical protein